MVSFRLLFSLLIDPDLVRNASFDVLKGFSFNIDLCCVLFLSSLISTC